MNSNIGYMSLKTFRMKPLNQETINFYKKTYPALKYVRWNFNTKGVLFLDSFYRVACYINTEIKSDGCIWIQALEVNEKYQNRGLGKQLLLLAIKDFNANYLSVNKNNEIAYHLYAEYGFEEYSTNGNMLFMKRKEIVAKSMESFLHKKEKNKAMENGALYEEIYKKFKEKYQSQFIEIYDELISNLNHSIYQDSRKYPYLQFVKIADSFNPHIIPEYHKRYYILETIISFFENEYLSRKRDTVLLENRAEDICRKYDANKIIYESKFKQIFPTSQLLIEKTDQYHYYLLQIHHIESI